LVTDGGGQEGTANVVGQSVLWRAGGIVDTHFADVPPLRRNTDPTRGQDRAGGRSLSRERTDTSHLLIWHGRGYATSAGRLRRPVRDEPTLCPSFGEGPTDRRVALSGSKPGRFS